jgi:hypothetical protein
MKILSHFLAIACVLGITGCVSTTPVVQPPKPVDDEKELQTITTIEKRNDFRCSDDYFEISGNDKEITNFTIKNQNADIQDLAGFSVALYRQELSPKLKEGEKLSERDMQLLEFCSDTQLFSIKAYTMALLSDMLEDTKLLSAEENYDNRVSEGKAPAINQTFDATLRDVCIKMQGDFVKSNSVTREKIRDFGKIFQPIDDKVLVADFFRIQDSLNQKIDSFQWRQIWLYVPYVQFATLWWETDFHEEPALRPYKKMVEPEISCSMQWHALHNSMAYRIKDLRDIYTDTETFLTKATDSRSKVYIDNFRLSIDNEMRFAIMLNAFVYNDLPFVVYSKKGFIDIQRCKGYMWDNDNKMEDVMNQYLVRISGADMLKCIRSPYSADIYSQLLKMLKSEWSDKRYQNYLLKSKIYELDQFSPTYYEDNKVK